LFKENIMTRKFIFPILVLALAVLACNLQTTTPTSAPEVITDTPAPPTKTNSPVITDTPAPTNSPVITDTPAVPTTASGSLTLDMLRNGTYHTPFYNRTVTLVNGSFSEGSGSSFFSVQMLNVYGFGDLNGDGKEDAAFILAENDGGSGVFISVIAVVDQSGTLHQEDQAKLGDRVQIITVDISSGVIHLDMVVHGPSDPLCCPSQPQKQNYWLIGNKLWLMRLNSTVGGTEHIINVHTPANWASVTNPFTISGSMTVLPFENTLAYHIYLIDGTQVNQSSFTVTPSGGSAGTFTHDFDLSSAGITDLIIIQFVDTSAADGSTIALGSIILQVH
jgi:hypothetical protein